MNGLDPAGIVGLRELILKLNREQGITFLISSHILTELSLIATKYGIISKGKLIREITAEQLHTECTKTTCISADDPKKLGEIVASAVTNQWEYTADGIEIETIDKGIIGGITGKPVVEWPNKQGFPTLEQEITEGESTTDETENTETTEQGNT
jgi:ABC-type multidrug transport system ATPase subunit